MSLFSLLWLNSHSWWRLAALSIWSQQEDRRSHLLLWATKAWMCAMKFSNTVFQNQWTCPGWMVLIRVSGWAQSSILEHICSFGLSAWTGPCCSRLDLISVVPGTPPPPGHPPVTWQKRPAWCPWRPQAMSLLASSLASIVFPQHKHGFLPELGVQGAGIQRSTQMWVAMALF